MLFPLKGFGSIRAVELSLNQSSSTKALLNLAKRGQKLVWWEFDDKFGRY